MKCGSTGLKLNSIIFAIVVACILAAAVKGIFG